MVNSALATGDFFKLSPGDKALYCLPTKYIAGKWCWFVVLLDLISILLRQDPILLANNDTIYDFVAMVPYKRKTH
jgi:O-succinylbenzoic acid--CoA ligase